MTASPQPRPAATVLLLRGPGPSVPELLMVRRSAKSPFMPSTFVFPGGRVDAADGTHEDDAFLAAARRECAEEVGLDVADRPLRWFDTWITPSAEPRRYHARFYLARLRPEEGQAARADEHETHDATWATADAFLARWEADAIDLPPPTLATLLALRGATADAIEGSVATLDPRAPILPKWIELDGAPCVVMPHDPDYAALPGASLPAPPRARRLPSRFRRGSRRWHPLP